MKDRQAAVNDIGFGLPVMYKVRFPIQNPVPKLTAIYYNDQLLCSGPKGCAITLFILFVCVLISLRNFKMLGSL